MKTNIKINKHLILLILSYIAASFIIIDSIYETPYMEIFYLLVFVIQTISISSIIMLIKTKKITNILLFSYLNMFVYITLFLFQKFIPIQFEEASDIYIYWPTIKLAIIDIIYYNFILTSSVILFTLFINRYVKISMATK